MKQSVVPERKIFYCGDIIHFYLHNDPLREGKAFLRTTFGNASVRFRELVEYTENEQEPAGLSWHDLPMEQLQAGVFHLAIPLTEVGIFESKSCFAAASDGAIEWVPGENIRVKVEPAANIGGNIIYTAFVRQFNFRQDTPELRAAEKLLDQAGYAAIPPSGTFRQLKAQLDLIMGTMGCRILQLLPIHPAPALYGKMGRFGSPFASLDYFAVDSHLAEFDTKATPLEQFIELIDAVHARNGRLFLDIPVNHTGWASKLQQDHPDYFVRKHDGTFVSPGAWGVTWADLCKLNYTKQNVHLLMAEVFLFWCKHGVDGFRCDAGYMLPEDAWKYIVAKVRLEYPDTVFMLEGLGGPPEVQDRLLNASDLNWAYSEFFQNYTKSELENYFRVMDHTSRDKGILVNFAETHDNPRLAAAGNRYAKMRCMLLGLISQAGAFGFTNGVEFFARERIDVHENASLNWGAPENMVEDLGRLNRLLRRHPAFLAGAKIILVDSGSPLVAAWKRTADSGESLLILANLDLEKSAKGCVAKEIFAKDPACMDLLGQTHRPPHDEGNALSWELAPGETLCLGRKWSDPEQEMEAPERQYLAEMTLVIYQLLSNQHSVTEGLSVEALSQDLRDYPLAFCARIAGSMIPPVVCFHHPADLKREIMLGEEKLIMIDSDQPFRAELCQGKCTYAVNRSIRQSHGRYFTMLIAPPYDGAQSRELELKITAFTENSVIKGVGHVLQLSPPERVRIRLRHQRREISASTVTLHSNNLGAMSQVRARWGTLDSKYDAVLAGNLRPDFPSDRLVMLPRCRAWVVYNDYSQELNLKLMTAFIAGLENSSVWDFSIPMGQGSRADLKLTLQLAENGNAVKLIFRRLCGRCGAPGHLSAEIPIKLIIRPDVDDRISHNVTKAYLGAEKAFPNSVRHDSTGFFFGPSPNRQLNMRTSRGTFIRQDEWHYMVHLEQEQYYGLEDKTDLFSPGYFEIALPGNTEVELFAAIDTPDLKLAPEQYVWKKPENPAELPVAEVIPKALSHFVVKRDQFHTVIAGYPWFLDWGRDTLIALRGLTVSGFARQCAEIIKQFAKFEQHGTIPNMIRGNDDSNRDTSDAPLWLFVAVKEYIEFVKDDAILHEECGNGRTLLQVLESIIANYSAGTPNGIKMDPQSGLIFSPSHFTWMDTNYPAGTPREGYPIEIQALWFASLHFLGQYHKEFTDRANSVAKTIEELFYIKNLHRFSDCLHAPANTPASAAIADDHVRPNQLFALTLGAVQSRELCARIVESAEELVIPGGIRSLGTRKTTYPLPIRLDGKLLNDPHAPYWGRYNGPEDTERKPAYHNGTAWGWPFPSYCEALFRVGGESSRKRALSLLYSFRNHFNNGVPGQVPEVLEGDYPHKMGGCPAQAWSASEFARVYNLLKK